MNIGYDKDYLNAQLAQSKYVKMKYQIGLQIMIHEFKAKEMIHIFLIVTCNVVRNSERRLISQIYHD